MPWFFVDGASLVMPIWLIGKFSYKRAVLWRCFFLGKCVIHNSKPFAGWWFQRFWIFTPVWGRFPFWLIFFRWVETTKQFVKAWKNSRPFAQWAKGQARTVSAGFRQRHGRLRRKDSVWKKRNSSRGACFDGRVRNFKKFQIFSKNTLVVEKLLECVQIYILHSGKKLTMLGIWKCIVYIAYWDVPGSW